MGCQWKALQFTVEIVGVFSLGVHTVVIFPEGDPSPKGEMGVRFTMTPNMSHPSCFGDECVFLFVCGVFMSIQGTEGQKI